MLVNLILSNNFDTLTMPNHKLVHAEDKINGSGTRKGKSMGIVCLCAVRNKPRNVRLDIT